MWISFAEQPLSPNELYHAFGLELGSTDFNADNIPSITTLVGSRQGFITVDKEASGVPRTVDRELSRGRPVCFALQEYLSAHPDIFGRLHSAMAEICLTYGNFLQVKTLATNFCCYNLGTPFLIYICPCTREFVQKRITRPA